MEMLKLLIISKSKYSPQFDKKCATNKTVSYIVALLRFEKNN